MINTPPARRIRPLRLGPAVLAAVLAAATVAPGQTNLLVNGDFETNAGFSFPPDLNCQDFWGGFCGFEGWNTDLVDNGVFDFSWAGDTPGGLRLANVFPAGGAPNDPVLVGDGSMLILGSFDPNTPSVLLQQVAVTPGQSVRAGIFAFSDSTRINANNFPDTVYGQFSRNRVRMRLEFYDSVGVGEFIEDTEVVIFDPENDPGFDFTTFRNPLFEDKWIEAAATVTVPEFAAFARIAILFDQVNNGSGLAFADTASIVNLSAGSPAAGDFDFSGVLDAGDLGMLNLAVIGKLVPDDNRFDLTGDSLVTAADVAAWQQLAATPGDYNGDGVIDAADYTVWRDTLNSTTQLAADGNRDGVVNAADYSVWDANYGGPAPAASVPEPAALASLVCMLVAAARRR